MPASSQTPFVPPPNPTGGLMKMVAYGAIDATVAPNLEKEHSTIHAYPMEALTGGWRHTVPSNCDLWRPHAVILNLTESITPETLRSTVLNRRPTLTVRTGGQRLTEVTTQLLLLEEPVLENPTRVILTVPWKRMVWSPLSSLMMASSYTVDLVIDGPLQSAELLTIDYLLGSTERHKLLEPNQEIIFGWGGCRAEFTSDQWTTITSDAITDGFLFSYSDNGVSEITDFTWQLNGHTFIHQNQTMFNMSVEKLADNLYFYRIDPERSFNQKSFKSTLNCARIETMKWKFTFADGGNHSLDLTIGGANLFRRNKCPWTAHMICGMAYTVSGGLSIPGSQYPPSLAIPLGPPIPKPVSNKEVANVVIDALKSGTEAPALPEPENPWYQIVEVTSLEM